MPQLEKDAELENLRSQVKLLQRKLEAAQSEVITQVDDFYNLCDADQFFNTDPAPADSSLPLATASAPTSSQASSNKASVSKRGTSSAPAAADSSLPLATASAPPSAQASSNKPSVSKGGQPAAASSDGEANCSDSSLPLATASAPTSAQASSNKPSVSKRGQPAAASSDGEADFADASLPPDVTQCRVVISDGHSAVHRDFTDKSEELFQYCCVTLDQKQRRCCVSSDSTGKTVVMFVLRSTLLLTEHFQDLPADSRVSVLGFQFTGNLALSQYDRVSPISTHCIVGLPADISLTAANGDGHTILEYHPFPDRSATTKVLCGDFWRLLSFGRWVSCRVIHWYARLLSATNPKFGFRVEKSCVCKSLLAAVKASEGKCCVSLHCSAHDTHLSHTHTGDEGDVNWTNAEQMCPSELDFSRVVYLCFLDSHWTLAVFDVPNGRHGRMVVVDSLDIFDSRISAAFAKWFEHRGFAKVSFSSLRGGIQGDNITECGIFCMQNLDALFRIPVFFKVGDWQAAADQRTLEGCQIARDKYAAALREHSIQWLLTATAVPLAEQQVYVSAATDEDRVIVSSDSEGSKRKRRETAAAAKPARQSLRPNGLSVVHMFPDVVAKLTPDEISEIVQTTKNAPMLVSPTVRQVIPVALPCVAAKVTDTLKVTCDYVTCGV